MNPSFGFCVSDQDVVEREQKLEAGEIEELSHDEFARRVREIGHRSAVR
jgi:hypothetical protein